MEIKLPNLCKAVGKLEVEFNDGVINFSGTLVCSEDGTIPPVDPPIDPPIDPPTGVETIFLQQFVESPLTSAYDWDAATRDFGQIEHSSGIGWEGHYNVEIIDADVGRLMKINTIANEIGPDYGCLFDKIIDETEIWFSYNIRFSADWEPTKGGKLFGLGGENNNSGPGGGPSEGFSSRWMWQPDCALMFYTYYPDMDTEYGKSFGLFPDPDDPSKLFSFYTEDGERWFNFTQRVVLNSTPEAHDGILEAFIDGKLVQSNTGLRLRDADYVKIKEMMVEHFFGGNSDDYKPSKDQFIEVDDFHLFKVPATEGQPSEDGRDISQYLIFKD